MIKIKSINNATPEEKIKLLEAVEMGNVILNFNLFQKEFKGLESRAVDFHFFNRDSMVGGMANEEEGIIRFNSRHFKDLGGNVSTLIHEYMHLLGFDHVSSLDHSSVPYQAGFLARKLVREYGFKIKKMGIQHGKRLVQYRPWYFLWLIKKLKWE